MHGALRGVVSLANDQGIFVSFGVKCVEMQHEAPAFVCGEDPLALVIGRVVQRVVETG